MGYFRLLYQKLIQAHTSNRSNAKLDARPFMALLRLMILT